MGLPLILTRPQRPLAVDPRSLGLSVDGFAYLDYVAGDLSRLRQDNLNTPAALNQPVGMVFDDWIANTLGPNLTTNGTFDTTTTGWSAGSATLSVVSANLRVTNTGAAVGRATQSHATVVGDVHECTVDLVENANGAAIAMATSNSGTSQGLFFLTIAAGVTGSYKFYFIATTTTSHIQLRTNSTTAGHYTQWDNVVVKRIAGRHLLTQVAAARPILRQDASGAYYLEGDGTSTILAGGLSMTLQLPSYIACLARRRDSGATTGSIMGLIKSSVAYHRVNYATGQGISVTLRETTLGGTTGQAGSDRWGVNRLLAVDSLAIVGTNDAAVERKPPVTIANSWLAGTQNTLSAPVLFGTTPTAAAPEPVDIYGAFGFLADPGSNRPGLRAYLADMAEAD